ncbi:MAG: hypothetical protein JWN60_1754 [Acidobacteria bacterium]|jgi:hypothetical protein|nr:hypothetical protein [Acidobacteriota bacterium]
MNIAKPYTIKFEDRGEYLYAFVGGETLTPEIAEQYWEEIARERVNLKKIKILIEKDFVQSVSLAEMYEMGVNLSSNFKGKRIAFLDRRGNDEVNEFGQMVAQNQGVKMKVFKSIEDAEKWLIV